MHTATITDIDADSTVTYVTFTVHHNEQQITIGTHLNGNYILIRNGSYEIVTAESLRYVFEYNPHIYAALQTPPTCGL